MITIAKPGVFVFNCGLSRMTARGVHWGIHGSQTNITVGVAIYCGPLFVTTRIVKFWARR